MIEAVSAGRSARDPMEHLSMTPTEWSESADPEPMLGKVLPSASDRKRRLFAVACCRQAADFLIGVYSGVGMERRIDDYWRAVDTAERFADGEATSEELAGACEGAYDSLFANVQLDDRTLDEMRKATVGDDAAWLVRLLGGESDRIRREMESFPSPGAWLDDDDNAECYLTATVDPYRDVADKDAVLVGETIGRQVLLLVRHYDWEKEADERVAQAALLRDVFGDPYPSQVIDLAWRTPEATVLAELIYRDKALDRMPDLADALEAAGCDNPAILAHCRGPGPHVRGCWVLDGVLGKE
jgi:hypothetical protein